MNKRWLAIGLAMIVIGLGNMAVFQGSTIGWAGGGVFIFLGLVFLVRGRQSQAGQS